MLSLKTGFPGAGMTYKPKRVKPVCVGGRTEHLFEPVWRGNSIVRMQCRWCGKREAA